MIALKGENQKCHIHPGGSARPAGTGGILRNSDKGEFLMETPQQVMYAFYAVLMLAAAGIAA